MKILKYLFAVLSIIVCLGCITTKPTVNVDSQNIFTLTNPKLKLMIDKDLDYAGQFKLFQRKQGWSYNKEYYIFNKGSEIITAILIQKIPSTSTYHWLPIKIKKGEDGVIIDQGIVKFGKKQWKTFVQTISPSPEETEAFYSKNIDIDQYYIVKQYVRNVSEKTQIYVMYLESLKDYKKDLEQYNRLKTLTTEQAELINEFLKRAEKSLMFLD